MKQLSFFGFFWELLPKKTRVEIPAVDRPSSHILPNGCSTNSSDPELHDMWKRLRLRWFADRPDLDSYRVVWSGRAQKRTLASCSIHKRTVRVARELAGAEHQVWLEPLLYHEMCHAYLGKDVPVSGGRRRWHGQEFKRLEQRHPGAVELDMWVKKGGWARAVRSDRAKRAYAARKSVAA